MGPGAAGSLGRGGSSGDGEWGELWVKRRRAWVAVGDRLAPARQKTVSLN